MAKPSNQEPEITFPPFAPELKLKRRSPEKKSAAKSAAERTRPEVVQPAKPAAESPAEPTPANAASKQSGAEEIGGDDSLQIAWEQLHRARALFESEQEGVQQVRIGQRDFEHELKRREAEVAAREAAVTAREQAVAEREAIIASATPPAESAPAAAEESVVARLTKGPFAIARSVLGPKEKSPPDQP
jgi:hypothetical protein